MASVFVASAIMASGSMNGTTASCGTVSRTLTEIGGIDLTVSGIAIIDLYGIQQTDAMVVTSGHPFIVSVTVTNSGSSDAGGLYTSASIDGTVLGDPLYLEGLLAGASADLVWHDVVESAVGDHTITATVDSTGAVDESNLDGTAEENNGLSSGVTVRAAEWTVAIYMDSDNNLEAYGILDFLEMSAVGSSQSVSIVAQMDRVPGYSIEYGDWTGTERFLVTSGMTPTQDSAYEHLGEVNMADPTSLYGFATDTFQRFQADRTCLVLWDHGMNWYGGCCVDLSSSNDTLTTDEMRSSALAITAVNGDRIDLLGVDCCVMGSMDVCYVFRDTCDVYIGSETAIPLEGWPYDTVLQPLVDSPYMTPEQFAEVVVSEYALSYEATSWYVTLSAFWTASVSTGVASALTEFADAMLSTTSPNIWGRIAAARTATLDFDTILDGSSYNDGYNADLYCFASEVYDRVSTESVRSAASNLMIALEQARIASSIHSIYLPYYDSFGLSIFWPEQELYLNEYSTQDLAVDTSWDEFLVAFYMK